MWIKSKTTRWYLQIVIKCNSQLLDTTQLAHHLSQSPSSKRQKQICTSMKQPTYNLENNPNSSTILTFINEWMQSSTNQTKTNRYVRQESLFHQIQLKILKCIKKCILESCCTTCSLTCSHCNLIKQPVSYYPQADWPRHHGPLRQHAWYDVPHMARSHSESI
jgi:hypothetical protein